MFRRIFLTAAVGAAAAALALAAHAAPPHAYHAPRTIYGQPDLQGFWTNGSLTRLERTPGEPLGFANPAEERAYEKRRTAAWNEGEAGGLGQGVSEWHHDFGLARIAGRLRTSFIVWPADGRLPWRPQGKARYDAASAVQGSEAADGPESRSVLDRCLVGGGGGVGPPIMTPNTATGRQIVQTRDEVAILSEMNHDVRIVRLGARHQPLAVRPWMGDSIGHWEGETLVVETVGFHPEEGFRALFARRPIRTGLSILGIGLAVGSALALISLSRSIKDSTRAGLDEMGDDLVVMQKGASDIFGGFIPERTVERVAAIPGVARATGELFMFAPGAADRSLLTQGWSDTSYLWKKVPLREGRVPGPDEHGVAVLGDSAAASLGKKLDDQIEILGAPFRVIGIANYTTIINRGLILLPLPDLQQISARPEQVTVIHVNIVRDPAPANLTYVKRAIEALGNLTASTANDVLDKDRNFAILDAVSLAISIIAVVMGAIYVLNALVMATQERTREIGIFAAIGWSKRRIMASIVVEGVLMCVIGCALGLLLSFGAAFAFPHIPAIGNLVSFKPSIALIAPVLAAAFVLCILGSLFPAWRAVRMLPAEALRRI